MHQSKHALASHTQSEQVPLPGPLEVPVRQVQSDSHQPQSGVTVQPLQAVEVAHGSTGGPLQALGYQTQSLQVSHEGPETEPV